jgi:hypothetical protein
VASLDAKTLDTPDETRTFDNGKVEVVTVGDATVGRAVFQPGWRWSNDVKPIAGTESCQASHLGYVISGRLKVVHDDGSEAEVGPGSAYVIAPGHDAWVVGDEEFVALEFDTKTATTYAKE